MESDNSFFFGKFQVIMIRVGEIHTLLILQETLGHDIWNVLKVCFWVQWGPAK